MVPWSPVTTHCATASLTIVAPMGKPLPRALAVVRISGCADGGSEACAHKVPVRESPHWISS